MIRDFENWNTNIGEASQLDELKGMRVAIEAADYLNTRILKNPAAKEPLVPALGGLPLGLTKHIEDDLERFTSYQITPFFVFSGLDLAKSDDPFRQRQDGATINQDAWRLYDGHDATESVIRFGQSSQTPPMSALAIWSNFIQPTLRRKTCFALSSPS